ncbi:MAG: hypothetical protein GY884_21550 [Proteobacteria bacterium]|nr:hypothetical protein [Pseudomonadota bacterium]
MTFTWLILACLPELPVSSETTDCTAFIDADGDGFGGQEWVGACSDLPLDVVEVGGDCVDDDDAIHPDAIDVCDGLDNNCDGEIDEAGDLSLYADEDGDGWGAGDAMAFCEDPGEGWSELDGDCDDLDPGAYPDAPVDCSELDRNCDGIPDDMDADGDGYAQCEECDDTDETIMPGAEETCDGVDEDCDGVIDNEPTDGIAWYRDADGDGHGDPEDVLISCEMPEGYVAEATDCDDARADISPDADEICDGLDNDCSGAEDDDALDALTWYVDGDSDGYGVPDATTYSCTQPSGYAASADDCDDADEAYNPGATEDDCTDPNDYNCDGATGYEDGDSDGFAACEECDDADATINPDGTEVCDGVDNDCDGDVDEDDAADASTWYADGDGDGYGDAGSTTEACSVPSGYTSDATDCDDGDGAISPAATETCDDADNDCDGTIDEDDASDASTWYLDADADGYGDAATTTASCELPSGYADNTDDCDDSDADISPDGIEVCDSADNDCDGVVDPPSSEDAETWYRDLDLDGYGDASTTTTSCTQPSGYESDDTDCDDTDTNVNPGGTEVCNGVDDDCDGDIDNDATDANTYYADTDGDGYGDASSTTADCSLPSGYATNSSDCDDADGDSHPGGTEVCDDADNDCDGSVDESATDASSWWADADGDGHGDTTDVVADCDQPSGYVDNKTDCDDTDADANPDEDEVCDTVDNDCDGNTDENDAIDASTWYDDDDGDGYGDSTAFKNACDQPTGSVSDDADCDDSDNSVYPGADEYCDGVDNDCDGTTDEDDAVDASTFYADGDADGYGGTSSTTDACSLPSGYSSTSDDCDDTDDAIHPGATEVCDDEDNDCDGSVDEGMTDTDGDGTADCEDDCPVWADPDLTSNGDGSEGDPYMSINDAITLRGEYCDEITLAEGTYYETVDFGGDDLYILGDQGESKTKIDGSTSTGSVFTFTSGETAAATLEGVKIQNGTGTTGDGTSLGAGYTMSSSDTHGGGILIMGASPTLIDVNLKDNDATGFGGGIFAYQYDGTIEDSKFDGNTADADNYGGGGMYAYDSDFTLTGTEFKENEATGSSGDGGGLAMVDSDATITHNKFKDNDAPNSLGDAVRFYGADGLFANNIVYGHDQYALVFTNGSDIDVINNTIDDNYIGLYFATNGGSYNQGDYINNQVTNSGYVGFYATYYHCYYFGDVARNNVYNSGSGYDWGSWYCDNSLWPDQESEDPKYEDQSGHDYRLKSGSPSKDDGDDTDGYGVTDDYAGTSRSSGSYSIGAYEK